MIDLFITDLDKELNNTLDIFQKELLKYTTDSINTNIIEHIKINYYGTTSKLSQIAFISIENNNIIIKPFERSILSTVCNEINKLNIDLTTLVQEDYIKIIYPKMTVERRDLFSKKVKELGEKFKINIRNIRRDINNKIKNTVKLESYSKDDEKRLLSLIQTKTNDYIKKVDNIVTKKITILNKI